MSKKRKGNSTKPQQERREYTADELEEMLASAGMEKLNVQTDADGVDILPISKGRTNEGSYRFKIAGSDKVYRLPNLQYIDMDIAMKLRGGVPDDEIMGLMFERYAPDLMGQVDAEQITALTDRWRAHSKQKTGQDVSLGE